MLLTIKPKKIAIYVSNGKMTCAQVRQRTGCDICINGSLYDMKTMKPNCDVKVDGVVMSDDQYTYWGYGWNSNQPRATMSNNISAWQNYISCVGLLKDGKKLTMTYDKDSVGGIRGRTAFGYRDDGQMVIYCSKDGSLGACTPEKLADKMKSYGCVDALCLDGGKSCQIDSDDGTIKSSRQVANYVCIWEDKPISTKATAVCPYKEPTVNIRSGSRGEGAKWTQWYLNVVDDAGLSVDGVIGAKSVAAIKIFQQKAGLAADGISGKQTRAALKKKHEAED